MSQGGRLLECSVSFVPCVSEVMRTRVLISACICDGDGDAGIVTLFVVYDG